VYEELTPLQAARGKMAKYTVKSLVHPGWPRRRHSQWFASTSPLHNVVNTFSEQLTVHADFNTGATQKSKSTLSIGRVLPNSTSYTHKYILNYIYVHIYSTITNG